MGQGDCDNDDDTVYPGAEELCDGLDNDCDGDTPADEIDEDGDGTTPCEGDCDDAEAAVSPEWTEVCDDGLDNDCDGETDLDDPDCEDVVGDDDASDDDDDAADDDTEGAGGDCSCSTGGPVSGPSVFFLIAFLSTALRRRS